MNMIMKYSGYINEGDFLTNCNNSDLCVCVCVCVCLCFPSVSSSNFSPDVGSTRKIQIGFQNRFSLLLSDTTF